MTVDDVVAAETAEVEENTDVDGFPSRGPRDANGAVAPDGYLDLGALYVPKMAGLQLRGKFEADKSTLKRMLLILGASGVTVSVAAAPKTPGSWLELTEQIKTAITQAGGQVSSTEGPYGLELNARVASARPDGSKGFTPLRIIGVEGPRWLVRIDMQGAALTGDEDQKAALEELIDALIVNRGPEPRIRFELLPLTLPKEVHSPDGT